MPRKSSKKKTRKRQQSQPQPQPVQIAVAEPNLEPEKIHAPSERLLMSLKKAFSLNPSPSPSPSPSPQPSAAAGSGAASTSSTLNILPAEVERKLDAVPDVIGEQPEIAGPGEVVSEGEESLSSDDIREMLSEVSFEDGDVRDMLCEFFEWLAERFESEHWKLTDRQSRILTKPAAKLANALWAKLVQRLPDVIANWCESTPGLAGMLIAAGIVIVPKVRKQAQLSRGTKNKPVIESPKKPMAKVEPQPEAFGIPVAMAAAGSR